MFSRCAWLLLKVQAHVTFSCHVPCRNYRESAKHRLVETHPGNTCQILRDVIFWNLAGSELFGDRRPGIESARAPLIRIFSNPWIDNRSRFRLQRGGRYVVTCCYLVTTISASLESHIP